MEKSLGQKIVDHVTEHSVMGLQSIGSAKQKIVSANITNIQSAIDSITDNLATVYATGTLSVTNASAQITFSAAPTGANNIFAGLDYLYDVANTRYYEILKGASTTAGAIFTLNENYQGSTNAVLANTTGWLIVRPNPYKILVQPGIMNITSDITAIKTKPFVNVAGIDTEACVIRRLVGNTSNPLFIITHGSTVSNFTIEASDSLFQFYRMGKNARCTTSQTEAMTNSKWKFRDCHFNNIDPNGLDTGSDMYLSSQFYNNDEALFEDCGFVHCWDGFTPQTQGAGRVKFIFESPKIYKHPIPQSKIANAAGGTFWRCGYGGPTGTVDLVMHDPQYNQKKYAFGDIPGGTFGGLLGEYGFVYIGSGCTAKIIDPIVEMDTGATNDSKLRFGIAAANGSNVHVSGGNVAIAGTGGAGTQGSLLQTGTGLLEVGGKGKYSATAGTITYL